MFDAEESDSGFSDADPRSGLGSTPDGAVDTEDRAADLASRCRIGAVEVSIELPEGVWARCGRSDSLADCRAGDTADLNTGVCGVAEREESMLFRSSSSEGKGIEESSKYTCTS